MNKSIVLTGAAGFVGARLASRLVAEGFEVHALDVIDPEIPGVTFTYADISQSSDEPFDTVPKKAVFIHLAAVSTDSACSRDPISALSTNLMGTSRMIMLANARHSSKFVFASSEWVYPESQIPESCIESQDLQLTQLSSLYAITKLVGESLVSNLSKTPSVSLRFGIVYGPRAIPGSAPEAILLKVRNGETVEVGNLETARRYIFVDDLIEGILRVIASPAEHDNFVYNLAGNELLSLSHLVLAAETVCGKKAQISELNLKPSVRNPVSLKFNISPRCVLTINVLSFTPKSSLRATST